MLFYFERVDLWFPKPEKQTLTLMRNRNKAIFNAVRILQVTPPKFCRVFGSDRVDEEAQQEKNAPLRDGKAHGHIPSA